MTAPVLQAQSIHKGYRLGGTEIPVLRGIDVSVAEGEMLALLGASGAGKSTLLHVLGLLDPPDSGEVLYDGRPVLRLPIQERARLRHSHVGFVFQFYHLIPELTALQNVLLARMMHEPVMGYLRGRRRFREEAMSMLAEVGLCERARHRPSELSGGERQRVAIARALLARPRVILADEPTGNLDSSTADGVMDLLFRINEEHRVAFVLVTHNEEVARRCGRIVRLKDGRVVD
ncbi:MAG: ABC transporter ATP-binding protein [Planctomycetota bacterium]